MKGRWATWAVAAALLGFGAPVTALDLFGYFRDSIGGTSREGAQACFRTPGLDYKLRLGNECDAYAEWGFQQSVWKGKDGVEFTVGFMFDYDPEVMGNLGSSTPFGVQQDYVKVKVPQWRGAQLWMGKQYYRRENIDMIDFFYLDTSEPGGGVEDVDLGFGKLAASLFAVKGNAATGPASGGSGQVFWRPDARLYGIPVNANGALEIDANAVFYSRNGNAHVPKGADDAGASVWVTVEHTQEKLMGGSNKLALQWANGTAAQMRPGTPSFSPDPLNRKNQQLRVVDQLLVQPSPKLQALVGAVFQWKTVANLDGSTAKAMQWGIFARPVYYLSDYFKVQGDLGFTQIKPQRAKAMNLLKATVAPTLTPPPGDTGGFFVRPELRAFLTYGAWNDAAEASPSPPGGGAFGTEVRGLSYGLSVETWF